MKGIKIGSSAPNGITVSFPFNPVDKILKKLVEITEKVQKRNTK